MWEATQLLMGRFPGNVPSSEERTGAVIIIIIVIIIITRPKPAYGRQGLAGVSFQLGRGK